MTASELRDLQRWAKHRAAGQAPEELGAGNALQQKRPAPQLQRHKFNAQPDTRDGQRIDSKAEAAYYDLLKLKQYKGGGLLFFLRQVPFHLPGGVRYVVDFVEFWENGEVIFTDVKGMETATFKAKRRMVESLYPVKIRTAKRQRSGGFEYA